MLGICASVSNFVAMGGCRSSETISPTDAGVSKRRLKDFDVGQILGEGSFCQVLAGVERSTGAKYALKRVPKRTDSSHIGIRMEVHCLGKLQSIPFIVQLVGYFEDSTYWFGVMEYCAQGELWNHVDHSGCVDPVVFRSYVAQIIVAVSQVHSVGIFHRDLKAENILVDEFGRIRLIDFGSARDKTRPDMQPLQLSEGSAAGSARIHRIGTTAFMAPEVIDGTENDWLSDIWSLGCTIYQIALGTPPFLSSATYFTWKKARIADLHFPSVGMCKETKSLIKSLCQPARSQRRGGSIPGQLRSTLEKDAFFAAVDWNALLENDYRPPVPSTDMQLLRIISKAYMKVVIFDEGFIEGSDDFKKLCEILEQVRSEANERTVLVRLGEKLTNPESGPFQEVVVAFIQELPADLKLEFAKFMEEATRRKRDINGENVDPSMLE